MKHERHGKTKTPEYSVWRDMKRRCHNPNNKYYPGYGGRGIKVCKRWRQSFTAFLEDMGQRPGDDYSIDRIDNNGNYSPKNCRWATRSEQQLNKRRSRRLPVGIYKTKSGRYRSKIGRSINRKYREWYMGTYDHMWQAKLIRDMALVALSSRSTVECEHKGKVFILVPGSYNRG